MRSAHTGKLQAVVQTAEQAGGYVRVITRLDFTSRAFRRSIFSEEAFATAAAEEDAGVASEGDAREKY
ncbi:hypothetical protein [Paraburkholderia sp. BL10I2N1]|uniref:hypothetical protein n=1 Tax=Paraburkholderia sp. BL10I2N1 TaxID=1938796 RepID=UPI00105DBB4A|nr:hypothetical protein [Paraburkholderia sp. BL10I2N1]TDN63141.1 hypothetical protein B0G77_6767 [Paraburkholderia sp. BL10I2N1]